MKYRGIMIFVIFISFALSLCVDGSNQCNITSIDTPKSSSDDITITWIRPSAWIDLTSRVKITSYNFNFQIGVDDALGHTFVMEYQFLKTGYESDKFEFDNNVLTEIPITTYLRGDYDFKITLTSIADPMRIVIYTRLIELDVIFEINVLDSQIQYNSDGQNTQNRFAQASFNIIHSSVMQNRNFKTKIPSEYSYGSNYNIYRGTNKIYPTSGSNNLEKVWFTNEYKETDLVLFYLPLPTYSESQILAPTRSQDGSLIQRIDLELNSLYDFTNLTVTYSPSYMFQEGLWNYSLFMRDGLTWVPVENVSTSFTETFGSVNIIFTVDEIFGGTIFEYRLEAILLGQERNTTTEIWMLPIFPVGMFILIWLPFTWKEMGYNSLKEKLGTGKYLLITFGIVIAIYIVSHLIFRFT